MPRKKITKTAAVQEFLGSNMKNAQIVEAVKAKYKLAVTPSYVSIIKSKTKTKAKPDTLTAAIQFVRAAGGLEPAKNALRIVEEIQQLA